MKDCCVYFVLARIVQPKPKGIDDRMLISFSHQTTLVRHERAFSLIEMVTVIAILVILMTSGVSLLNGTGAQSRKAASDTIAGLVEQARTIAITSRSDVLVAIAEPGDLAGSDERCRIGLFRLKKPVTGSPVGTTDRYEMLTRWQPLNTGVILARGEVDGVRNALDDKLQMNILYSAGNKDVTVNAHAISINSRGGLVLPKGSDPVVFRITEGGYRGGSPTPNIRGDSKKATENHLKIGRVNARPYRID